MASAPAQTLGRTPSPLRQVKLAAPEVVVEPRRGGTLLLRSPHPLPPHPQKITERLIYWAEAEPERIFLAKRDASGGWRTLTYVQALAAKRAIATALLERAFSP